MLTILTLIDSIDLLLVAVLPYDTLFKLTGTPTVLGRRILNGDLGAAVSRYAAELDFRIIVESRPDNYQSIRRTEQTIGGLEDAQIRRGDKNQFIGRSP